MTAPKEKPKKEEKVKVERVRQNGHTRPVPGSKTGIVWDIADEISQKMKRPALRNEVFEAYSKKVPDASAGTCGTQYSRWCAFHNVAAALKAHRDSLDTAKQEAKAKKEADKKAKADAAAQKKADAAKAKADKAQAAKDAKAEKKAPAKKSA